MTTSKTLKPVDDNVSRVPTTPGTKMRHLKADLQAKETENEALRGNIDELTKAIGKLEFVNTASVALPTATTTKDNKKVPVVPAKTAYKFFCDAQTTKKNDNMQQVWKEASADIRSKYQALAKADKDRYTSEMEAYNEEQRALELYYEQKKQKQAMAFYEAHLEAKAAVEKAEEEAGKGKKKKKVAKDSEAPKRCTSSYMFFAQEKRAEVAAKNPDAKVTDISKILGEMWKDMAGKKVAKKYEDMAAQDRERYSKEKAVYDAMMAERKQTQEAENQARLEQEKKEAMELLEAQSVTINIAASNKDDVSVMSGLSGGKKVADKKKKDPNAPKRALSAYNYFMKENRESIKAKMAADTKNTEVVSEVAKQWNALSDAKKKKYTKMATKDQERYAGELKQYNAAAPKN